MFNLFKKKAVDLFTADQKELITSSIRSAEERTSGQIRVFIESKCSNKNTLQKAKELFYRLKMEETKEHNGVLVYVAIKDKRLAVFGDEGIHQKVGDTFWNDAVQKMISHFNKENYAYGIARVVQEIGDALQLHFPHDKNNDINELPDDIVFGK